MNYHLYLLSDATGETVEHVARAALSQFKGVDIKLHKFTNLRSRSDVLRAVEGATGQRGLVVYTLVDPELTELLRSEVANHGLEAVDFTVKQDDGQELRNLCKADFVLVGVSRTSKTPLSMYLAHKGYKVANVPLVKGIDPPRELFQIEQKKVVALIIDAKRLVELRSARLRNLRQNPRGSYADYEEVE